MNTICSEPEARTSPIAALLEMIERRAPLLMRAGGGGVEGTSFEDSRIGQPLTSAERAAIWRRWTELRETMGAGAVSQTAKEFNVCRQTVWRVTREQNVSNPT